MLFRSSALLEERRPEREMAEGADSTGIGLKNVRNRLRLYYDREDLFSIYSEGAGRGTTVTILLPDTDGGSGEDGAEGDGSGDNRSGEDGPGEDSSGEETFGEDRSGGNGSGEDRFGKDESGEDGF